MDALEILTDLARRPLDQLDLFWDDVDAGQLNAHPGGHPNSIAWLIWHAGRETDAQIAWLAGAEEAWTAGGWTSRFGPAVPADGYGYGQSPAQARAVVVTDKALLRDYLAVVSRAAMDYLARLRPGDLDEVIDADWDPPVTRGVRLVSIFADALQHVGQAAYVAGSPERH
ncbi:MAG: DinB family protein [Micrococcus sp.]|nr:DinB family protein [Micrococcus sp.]